MEKVDDESVDDVSVDGEQTDDVICSMEGLLM